MLKKIINKFLTLYVLIRHPGVPKPYFHYFRDTYYCQLVQLKYIIKDYLIKDKYKTITYDGEFAPEIQFALPFAYWHYKNGTLKNTNSSKFTKELYFFSPDHSETFDSRTPEGNYNFEMPRTLYSQNYNMSKWEKVPLKEQYKNDLYVFDKPILIIANRYNMEWDGPPISFYDKEALKFIFDELRDKFTIVYNRPRPQNIISDNSDIYDMDEYEWIEEHYPDVVLMENLYKENKGKANNFNHLQLMVYANSEHFISIHGGTATLASYFGGVNLIFSKKGPEHYFGCYHKLYPKFSGATILHANTEEKVQTFVRSHFSGHNS